ncbi:Acetyl-CoA acetyltransferase [Desulfatibacillum alkenivorans DSM 16219]|jgi:acetyl-CoA acetyltransferase|uniref:Acetyl-CoA acetyltransferase n=1 Tax=Desulfatibacillum alkenivorans DSM 16219 TaxID=1121393 RepID=A0A1M6FB71_9BACT|nr:thiolase family protein [Desulfatibacillum alkenivorans]SHI94994.1 Acetyl-CoA acetyltransferase [Desulfatibacillum alkenivorans DSM 16219]
MRDVAIVGVGMTRFGKYPDKGIKELVAECVDAALADAELEKDQIEAAYMGSAATGLMTGQEMIRAQVTLSAMGIEAIPMYNVENACASSSTAFHTAWTAVGAGLYDVALVVGFEKLFDHDKKKSFTALGAAVDVEMVKQFLEEYEKQNKTKEKILSKGAGEKKSIFMDMYAYYTKGYMQRFGLTQEHFAKIAVKSHKNGANNPHAQYQEEVTLEQVLQSGDVSYPLTRMMCSPIGDGSAAAIICSKEVASRFKNQPVWVAGSVIGSGKLTAAQEDTLTKRLGPRAFDMAGITPKDLDLIEVHDATSPSEIITMIELGICPGEEAGAWIDNGVMEVDGDIPVNTSGGLASKGHPIGATGLGQIHEVVKQLRGEAGKRQVKNPKIGMTHNGGGILGVDAAAMALHIFRN